MSMMINNIPTSRVHPATKQVVPVVAITALNAAKAHRSPQERAPAAARYVQGTLLVVEPTAALAARTFNTSQSAVCRALSELAPVASTPLIDLLWRFMDRPERDRFMQNHADQILRALDRLTSS
jgi:hypothetical protein